MKKYALLLFFILLFSCRQKKDSLLTAQQIVDKSIEVCGGDLYKTSNISFDFRDITYTLDVTKGQRILKRVITADSSVVVDVRHPHKFERYINDSLVVLHDTLANKYANSVNSVHYFAYLPFGLNDAAVNKELLEKVAIEGQDYYKVKVTFDQKGGGKDFDDIYVYWFNADTFKPDFLAYEFHVDGGGMRFREAYNERSIGGIRFVDYNNYEPEDPLHSIYDIDSLLMAGKLKLLSKIELKNITLE
ncbi:DUF6503 family protein [Maribacter algicola]|uniref:DUF6503 family protein n=1 Tax=Meishania litoralis TaxID=3434685 RepID=A0ACC7LKU2_9FLAO